ncbi:calcium-binding and spermatid-specific protein 1, partial [Ranitomeya variabilis]|uniref:calcium-binding and spermatid-specific protein 1 n=1 Tax=Ranitomeya variabilis TaxID=490064 RepID=UPI0040567CD3
EVDISVKTEETVETSLSTEDSSKTEEEVKDVTTEDAVITLSVSQEKITVTTQHTAVDHVDISVKAEKTVDTSVSVDDSSKTEEEVKIAPTEDAVLALSLRQEQIVVSTEDTEVDQVGISVKREETVDTSPFVEDSSKPEEEVKIATKDAVLVLSLRWDQIVVTTEDTEVNQADISLKTEETVEKSLSVEDSSKTEAEVKTATTEDAVIALPVSQEKITVTTQHTEVDQVDISVKTEETVETSVSVEDSSKTKEEVKIAATDDDDDVITISHSQKQIVVTAEDTKVDQVDISVKTEETVETSLSVEKGSRHEEKIKIETIADTAIMLSLSQEQIVVTTEDTEVDISVKTEETVETSLSTEDSSKTEEEVKDVTTQDAKRQ